MAEGITTTTTTTPPLMAEDSTTITVAAGAVNVGALPLTAVVEERAVTPRLMAEDRTTTTPHTAARLLMAEDRITSAQPLVAAVAHAQQITTSTTAATADASLRDARSAGSICSFSLFAPPTGRGLCYLDSLSDIPYFAQLRFA